MGGGRSPPAALVSRERCAPVRPARQPRWRRWERASPRGGQRPARTHLGRVRQRRAFELAGLDEAVQEHPQPCLDRGKVVLVAPVLGQQLRPRAAAAVTPRVVGEVGDPAGSVPEPQRVVQMEILQLVGADDVLGPLQPRLCRSVLRRHELRGDLGVEDRGQHPVGVGTQLPAVDHPPDQVGDEGLRDRGVRVVMRHLVPDAVGAPAQRQLGQVAGADHQRLVLVGQPEQVRRAFAGLHILVGHVVDRGAVGRGVAEVAQHLRGGRPDVDLVGRHPQRGHEPMRVGQGGGAGREPGQRVGEHVRAGQAEAVHRPDGDEQRLGGVQTAGHADHRPVQAGGLQPGGQALHLDVVHLRAACRQAGRVGGHVREAGDVPSQTYRFGPARPRSNRTRRMLRIRSAWSWPASVKLVIRIRSAAKRARSTSAVTSCSSGANRSLSASTSPFSQTSP